MNEQDIIEYRGRCWTIIRIEGKYAICSLHGGPDARATYCVPFADAVRV